MSSARAVSNKVVSIPSQTDRRAAEAVPNSRSPNSQRRGITTVDEAECPVSRRGSAARGVCDGTVAEGPGQSRMPALVLPACPVCQYAWRLRWQPARKTPVKKTVAPLRHAKLRPSPTIGTPGRARRECALILWTDERTLPQIGQDDFNPPLAGRQGVAVFTSGRGSGGGGGGPVSSVKKGRRHRHRELLVICRARAGLSKSGQESHRTCARCRHSGHDFRVDTRNRVLATPTSACHAVYAPSFSSCTFFHYNPPTALRKPTCQALTQSCGRDRAMTAPASAVTLRGFPKCHWENTEPTVRPRSASESGTVQIFSVTSSCAASGPRRSDSIAERESVAAGTRVGVRDAAARRGTGNCLRRC
ncbi:hypothetical protein TcYC6_0039410 [Trypanosoma cruzi]|nr:hypothetical protein TcYC6_0039410 [Trypanosoma cruzi]